MILDETYKLLGRFVAYPSEEARIAHTLWIAHAHLMDVWENTPRLAFLSPEPASGKSRGLEVTALLVPRPTMSFNSSAAYIFRKVADSKDALPTILFDEVDTVFGDKARENEDLRGLINGGHCITGTVGRCVIEGDNIVATDFPAYCAIAMAGLGNLPDTILTRSIIVRMKRRRPDEKVEPFRRRKVVQITDPLREQLASWCASIKDTLADDPEMPLGIEDRDADVWESLLAIADAAGGEWPQKARAAAVALVSLNRRDGGASLGLRLLRDLRTVFEDHDNLFTSDILNKLRDLAEAPWSNIKGEPIGDRLLASLLKQYGVESCQVRVGKETKKGYKRIDLFDAWERYLPKEETTAGTTPGEERTPGEELPVATPPIKPAKDRSSPMQQFNVRRDYTHEELRFMPMDELTYVTAEYHRRGYWSYDLDLELYIRELYIKEHGSWPSREELERNHPEWIAYVRSLDQRAQKTTSKRRGYGEELPSAA